MKKKVCHRSASSFWGLTLLLLAAPVTSQTQAPSPVPNRAPAPATDEQSQLRDDTRLQRKVTLDETSVSVGELLNNLSDSNVNLSCSPSCAQQKVQVRLKERTLCAFMEALADLLPGAWQPVDGGKGYRLGMAEDAVRLRERWWRLYLKERERTLASLRANILKRMRRKPYVSSPGDPNPENVSPQVFGQVAREQMFWNLLPASLQEHISDQIVENALYRSGNALYLGTPLREGAVVVPFASLPKEAQAIALENAARLLNGNTMGAPSIITFNNGGYFVRPRLATPEGKWWSAGFELTVPVFFTLPTLPLDHRGLPQAVKSLRRQGKAVPETWKQFAAYQESRVWPNDPPTDKPSGSLPPRRPDVLRWLADKGKVEFVADFYSLPANPLPPARRKEALSRPLEKELDYRAAEQDMSWKQRDDSIYLFRNNRWYRDDHLEVPATTLKRLLALLPPDNKPDVSSNVSGVTPETSNEQARRQMDLAAEIVTMLGPWQIANGLTYYVRDEESNRPFDPQNPAYTWRPFSWIADRTLTEYNTVRFYAGLNSSQRTALFDGQLSVAALTLAQQQQALFVLPELQVVRGSETTELVMLGFQQERPLSVISLGYNASTKEPPLRLNLVVTSPVAAK